MPWAKDNYLGKDFHGYHIVAQLARHAGKRVYVAHAHASTDEVVIIKVFTALKLLSPQSQEDFLQEARFLASSKNPHLLPILAIGIENGNPYSIMPYVARGSLRQRMQRHAPALFAIAESKKLVVQLGTALELLHKQNIVHSNLKPENVFFTSGEGIIFADPDLATLSDIFAGEHSYVTASAYLAPEQAVGTVTQKSDQYALGCMAYELFTGSIPCATTASVEKRTKTAQGTKGVVTPPLPILTKPVQQVLRKATATDPKHRYETITDFLYSLETAFAPVAIQEEQPEKLVRLLSPDEATVLLPSVSNAKRVALMVHETTGVPAVFVERGKKRHNTAALWILLVLLAFILVAAMVLSPFIRGKQSQIHYRPVAPISGTKIVGNPVATAVATTPPLAPSPTLYPTVSPGATAAVTPTTSPQRGATPIATATLPVQSPPVQPTPTQPPLVLAPQLTSYVSSVPAAVNLTSEGTLDWVHWGIGPASDYMNRKSGVTPLISTFTHLGGYGYNNFGSNPTGYTWFDGVPMTRYQNVTSGIATYTDNNGFQISVAAGTATRTLRLYMSIGDTRCNFSTSLSGNHTLTYTDTSFYNPTGNTRVGVYTITFRADTNNQTLTVAFTQMNSIGAGYITIQAATLQ